MSKKLVAYFSASGVTGKVAERLAKAAGADLFEIRPVTPYTDADLNWRDDQSRSTKEKNDRSIRPEIAEKLSDISGYDTIFIGFPIWWYTAPNIIGTFLEQYDFSGKTMVPFATSGGSQMDDISEDLEKICLGAKWNIGRLLNRASDSDLAEWAKKF